MKKALRMLALIVIIAAGAIVGLSGSALLAVQCIDSTNVRTTARKLLTPEELKTLRPIEALCSGIYVFKRNGENQCISVGESSVRSCG